MQMLVTERSFVNGVLVEPGFVVDVPESQLSGKETNFADASGLPLTPSIQIAAIAPTGPNPRMPQQIAPDMVQNAAGGYSKPGANVVAEVTQAADDRFAGLMDAGDTSEGEHTQALADARVAAAGGTVAADTATTSGGTAAEIIAALGGQTDDQLREQREAEVARDKPRKTVTDAIDAELAKRAMA